jgi:hypothetical protein
MPPKPPSFPTRRSRIARDCVFVLAVLAWVGAMYAVRRENRARALTEAGGGELAVFTDAFEQNLRLLVRAKVAGSEFKGEAVRRTKEPWDGRLVVRDRVSARGDLSGVPVIIELSAETHWDRGAGGLRRMTSAVRFLVPGLVDQTIHCDLTRHRDARAGDMLVLRIDAPGHDPRRRMPVPVPPGAEISMDYMPPALVRPVRVGVRWETCVVSTSGEVTVARVEVVEKGRVSVAGVETEAYRAVTRVEKDTGRSVETAETWYDSDGRALVQTLRVSAFELTLERAERLAASDEEFEKLAMPERASDDGPSAPGGAGGTDE